MKIWIQGFGGSPWDFAEIMQLNPSNPSFTEKRGAYFGEFADEGKNTG